MNLLIMNNLVTYENFIVEKKTTHNPFHGSLNREERNEFIKRLQKNIIVFRYKKRDGSIRKAEGTLHPKFLPPPKSDKEYVRPEYQIVYYDLDKKAWRSFRSFQFIEILSTRSPLSYIDKKKKSDEDEKIKKLKKGKNVDKDEEDDIKEVDVKDKDTDVKEKVIDKKDEDIKDKDIDEKDIDVEGDDTEEEIDDRAKGEILKDRRKKNDD